MIIIMFQFPALVPSDQVVFPQPDWKRLVSTSKAQHAAKTSTLAPTDFDQTHFPRMVKDEINCFFAMHNQTDGVEMKK